VIVSFNGKTSDQCTVSRPLTEIVLTADYLRTDITPDAVLLTLATISNHAANGLRLDKLAANGRYTPQVDSAIVALLERIEAAAHGLTGYVHADFIKFMLQSCGDATTACQQRMAAHVERKERAA
jgi:hypothetical protein